MQNLLTIHELAVLLHTNASALKTRHYRNPLSIPPVVRIPGDRRYFFNANQVERWIESFAVAATVKRGPGRPRKGGR